MLQSSNMLALDNTSGNYAANHWCDTFATYNELKKPKRHVKCHRCHSHVKLTLGPKQCSSSPETKKKKDLTILPPKEHHIMAADKDDISLSRVHSYYSKCKLALVEL